jgi:Fe(3+) dicitrate transport protein
VEHTVTGSSGWYVTSTGSTIDEELSRARTIVLGGLGVSLKLANEVELYSNATQNFRAINYSDMRITSPTFLVDTNLKDESGYTLDLGFRGASQWYSYDVSGYYLRYNDRLGTINKTNPQDSSSYQFRTNAYTTGIEAVVDVNVSELFGMALGDPSIHVMLNASRTWGEYISSQNASIEGKQVELVPTHIVRCGLNTQWKGFSMSLLASFVGEQFSDASNTVSTANAVNGIIPAYSVVDLSVGYQWSWLRVDASCNNLLNTSYFTRRAGGAPGPGIIPAEPLSLFATVRVSL